jgi:hypothetical protein
LAIASQEPSRTRFHLLLEAATSLSVAAEACISRLGQQPCAPEGTQEWFDVDAPFDEHVVALEYLLAAVELR